MKKRILSLLLILCMAVTLLPTAVFAEDATGKLIPAGGAKIGETVYQTLEAAVTAAASGDTIVLGEGNYTLYNVSSEGHTKGKDLTLRVRELIRPTGILVQTQLRKALMENMTAITVSTVQRQLHSGI